MVSSRKTQVKGGKKKMQPSLWQPLVELRKQEELIVKKIRKAKLFVFNLTEDGKPPWSDECLSCLSDLLPGGMGGQQLPPDRIPVHRQTQRLLSFKNRG